MTNLYMCLLIVLDIVTKERKLRTKACKKTPSSPLNDSICPSNERNEEFATREDVIARITGRDTRG